jgi:hypothetical protein
MSNLTKVVWGLKKEHDQLQRRIERLNEALKALTGLGTAGGRIRRRGPSQVRGKRRTMSLAARKKIAAAQRARWAKVKADKKRKQPA